MRLIYKISALCLISAFLFSPRIALVDFYLNENDWSTMDNPGEELGLVLHSTSEILDVQVTVTSSFYCNLRSYSLSSEDVTYDGYSKSRVLWIEYWPQGTTGDPGKGAPVVEQPVQGGVGFEITVRTEEGVFGPYPMFRTCDAMYLPSHH